MDVEVVEDEAAAVQVHDHAVGGAVRAVQPAADAPGVDIAHLGDVLARLGGGELAGLAAVRGDVVAVGPDRRQLGGLVDGPLRLRVENHRFDLPAQRCISASRPTAIAAATRKSTRWSGTCTV